MKFPADVLLLLVTPLCAHSQNTPVAKVITMLSDLEQKIIAEGQNAQKIFTEFTAFCEDRAKNLEFEVKTGENEVGRLNAEVADQSANINAQSAKMDELAGNIAVDEADLAAAIKIRDTEAAAHTSLEGELTSAISMLQRAIAILEREMQKGGASMLQLKNAESVADALRVMVEASAISSADATKLAALVQTHSQSNDEDADEDVNAPAAAVYKSHSKNIVDTLRSLLDDAEAQLDSARKAEVDNLRNFQLIKQSLEDEIKFGNADKESAEKERAAASEKKSSAEGDLFVTSQELTADQNTLAGLHQDCMTRAQDFEAETKSRAEELKALGDAKKALTDNTGKASEFSYSFLQTSRSKLSTKVDLANFEAVRRVRDLARRDNSVVLEQLAERMSSAMHQGTMTGEDPFAKVKGLITDMIARLESEASADATKKAYCDKELKETNEKKAAKNAEISKQTTRIDEMSSKSSILKQEVAALQKALADLAASQASMDKIRKEENAAFVVNKADLEQGLEGVKLALKILREYYGSEKHAHTVSGSGSGIIGMLEVIESDFSKNLAEETAAEEAAAAAYVKQTKENEIERTAQQKSVEYKTKEYNDLDKEVASLTTDREGVQAELSAVMQYLANLEAECIERAETFESRKARFESEIAGLKDALNILETETALVQRKVLRRRVRSLRASS